MCICAPLSQNIGIIGKANRHAWKNMNMLHHACTHACMTPPHMCMSCQHAWTSRMDACTFAVQQIHHAWKISKSPHRFHAFIWHCHSLCVSNFGIYNHAGSKCKNHCTYNIYIYTWCMHVLSLPLHLPHGVAKTTPPQIRFKHVLAGPVEEMHCWTKAVLRPKLPIWQPATFEHVSMCAWMYAWTHSMHANNLACCLGLQPGGGWTGGTGSCDTYMHETNAWHECIPNKFIL